MVKRVFKVNHSVDKIERLLKNTSQRVLIKKFSRKAKPLKPPRQKKVRVRRHVIVDMPTREAIIVARYGTLAPNQPARCPVRAIGEYFHVPYSTVLKIIDRFRQTGRVIKKARGRQAKEIPAFTQQLLMNKNTLDRWASYNLQ